MYDRDRCETLEEKEFEAHVSCELTASNNDAVHSVLEATGQVKLPIVSHSQVVRLEWSSHDKYIEAVIVDGTIDSWFFRDSRTSKTISNDYHSHETLFELIREHFGDR